VDGLESSMDGIIVRVGLDPRDREKREVNKIGDI
jgi:hypothetical protein